MKKFFLIIILSFLVNSLISAPSDTYIMIIGGGKIYQDAVNAKIEYQTHKELNEQIITDVEIILSDTIIGLNPGFYIAIIGFCEYEYKARLITNFANKYQKGVYMKKVYLNEYHKTPVFKPQEVPFKGIEFNLLLKKFKYVQHDMSKISEKYVHSSPDKAIVKDDIIAFSRQIGLLDVKYYIAWIPEIKEVVFINQFQFSNFFNDTEEWKFECEIKS